MTDIRLTQYSHGAGCGCKISPKQLDNILDGMRENGTHPRLLVGNAGNDDAAAFDLGNGTSVLSTTDFFMPIVDDPFTFGRIAATNAISDIYAMGGTPLMAISIFGWPVKQLSDAVARDVIEGGRAVCEAAGIPLAGGHSIDSPEPIFGLAVTGLVDNTHLKRNDTAEAGCELFLTKPIGIGILTTAQKNGVIAPGDIDPAVEAMTTLNKIGASVAKLEGVTAVTDVTGFGLLGHLSEMCEGSGIGAVIRFEDVPLLPKVREYLAQACVPGGTRRNFESYGHTIGLMTPEQQAILCDAQTSGGLLCAVRKEAVNDFVALAQAEGLVLNSIGETCARGEHRIDVI